MSLQRTRHRRTIQKMASMTSWRDIPVLEAILRLNRSGRIATPENIAAEALLHLGDVYDSIAALIKVGIIEVAASSDEVTADALVVTLSRPFASLIRYGVLSESNRASTSPR